jgi:hypothetical protein
MKNGYSLVRAQEANAYLLQAKLTVSAVYRIVPVRSISELFACLRLEGPRSLPLSGLPTKSLYEI